MISKEKIVLSGVCVILLTILLMAIFGEKGLTDLYRLKKELANIVEKNERIGRENRLLLHEIDRLKNDLSYVESVARKDLGFISKEEFVFQSRTSPSK